MMLRMSLNHPYIVNSNFDKNLVYKKKTKMNLIDKANEICMLWNDSFTAKMKSTRLSFIGDLYD